MRKPCSVRNILKNSGQSVFKTGGYDNLMEKLISSNLMRSKQMEEILSD